MKKINISPEELETMNYNDIAYVILEANDSKMKLQELFLEVCKLIGAGEDEFQTYIADFFELLSTDKRFIMLDEGYWDLKIKHHKGMDIDSEDEEEDEDIILEDEDADSSEEDIYDSEKGDDDIEEDDLSDLVIIDDPDEENNL